MYIHYVHPFLITTSKNETSVPPIDFNIHKRNFHRYYKPQTNPISPCCANRIQSLFSALVMRLHSVSVRAFLPYMLLLLSICNTKREMGNISIFIQLRHWTSICSENCDSYTDKAICARHTFPLKSAWWIFFCEESSPLSSDECGWWNSGSLTKALWNLWSQHPCRFRVSGTFILKFLLCRFFLCC